MTEPLDSDDATRFSIADPAAGDAATDVYVDPWTAQVQGSLNPDTTLSGYAVRLHGDLMSGKKGDALIELGACWAIVMAITGYYMFFRGWKARKRRLASNAPGAKLRSRHAMVGRSPVPGFCCCWFRDFPGPASGARRCRPCRLIAAVRCGVSIRGPPRIRPPPSTSPFPTATRMRFRGGRQV